MPDEINDPALITYVTSTMLLSVGVCAWLVVARFRGPLLRFEPRKLVPWNVIGAALASIFVVLVLAGSLGKYLAAKPADEQAKAEQSEDSAASESEHAQDTKDDNAALTSLLIGWVVQELFVVGGMLLFVAIYFKATRSDLGLPGNAREVARDVFIGFVAGVASLAPIRVIQGVLLHWLGMPETKSGHQLVKLLTESEPSVSGMVLASIATVVVAPVCEEITFRLLLQGWLEKWETQKLCLLGGTPPQAVTPDDVQSSQLIPLSDAEHQVTDGDALGSVESSEVDPARAVIDTPPQHGVWGLPFGLAPIIVSSLLFGLAHFGYGPEPIPLFFLALMLGYVYHRTHRILPCIITHAIFNAFTMVVLWRIVFHGSQ